MKLISIVTPCFNEEQNVEKLYEEVKAIFINSLPKYRYEHIFIDNASVDNTVGILKRIAHQDKNVKIIVNVRNFGAVRSPYYGLLQSKGDAAILLVADFQDPLYLIPEFLKKWEEGYKIVIGTKPKSKENILMFYLRSLFYNLITKISETKLIKNFTGFGLYDKEFIDVLRRLNESYPYFRGLIADLGYERYEFTYIQPKRERGTSNQRFYALYDIAMLGFVNHSKVPIRLASLIGFLLSFFSTLVAVSYLVYKLVYWNRFEVGIAPLVIGIFFIGGVQLFFLGIIGEYIGSIFTEIKKKPLVIEKERINW
jgi:glycosyltransferase involved in cell wall biosynthesis